MTRWMARAACKGTDPAMWVPDEGDRPDMVALRAICDGCPVLADCRHHALHVVATTDPGVYAGMTQSQRRHIVRGTRRAKAQ